MDHLGGSSPISIGSIMCPTPEKSVFSKFQLGQYPKDVSVRKESGGLKFPDIFPECRHCTYSFDWQSS